MNRILFYRVNEPYGEFSNFAPYPIELKGKVWPTSEHYFQAQKFAGTDYEEAIRLAETPMVAANMGRNRERMLRLGWEGVKDDIMREALRAKVHPASGASGPFARDRRCRARRAHDQRPVLGRWR